MEKTANTTQDTTAKTLEALEMALIAATTAENCLCHLQDLLGAIAGDVRSQVPKGPHPDPKSPAPKEYRDYALDRLTRLLGEISQRVNWLGEYLLEENELGLNDEACKRVNVVLYKLDDASTILRELR